LGANILLTEAPKRYGGIIYLPPAYVLAIAFVLSIKKETLDNFQGPIPSFLFLGGLMALFLIFARPLEWAVLHGRNLPINMRAFGRAWKDSQTRRPERLKCVVMGRLRDRYRPAAEEGPGWSWSTFGSPYANEPRAKAFGAAYLAISMLVLYGLQWERVSKLIPGYALWAFFSVVLLVSLWSFFEFLHAAKTVGEYYFNEEYSARSVAGDRLDRAERYLALVRAAMERNDWSEAENELRKVKDLLRWRP